MDSYTETLPETFGPYMGPVFPVEKVKSAADGMQSPTPASSSSSDPFPETAPEHWNLDPIYDAEQFISTVDDIIAEAHPKADEPVNADFKEFKYTAVGVLAEADAAAGIDDQANADEAVETALSPQLMPLSDGQLMDFETQDVPPELALTPSGLLLLEELEEMRREKDEEPVELALDDIDTMDSHQISPILYHSPESQFFGQGIQLDGAANQLQNMVGALNVPFSEMHLNGGFSEHAIHQGNVIPYQYPQNIIHPRVEELYSSVPAQQGEVAQYGHILPVSQPLIPSTAGTFMGQQQPFQAQESHFQAQQPPSKTHQPLFQTQFPLPNGQCDSNVPGKTPVMTLRVFQDKSFHVSFNQST